MISDHRRSIEYLTKTAMRRFAMAVILVVLLSVALPESVRSWTSNSSNATVLTLGSYGSDSAYSVAVDSIGNLYVAGTFEGTVDFDPGPNISNLTASTNLAAFIVKFNSAGQYIWAKQFGGSVIEDGPSVAVDPNGSIYFAGYFKGTVDFDPGPGVAFLTSVASTYSDIVVVALSSSGDYVWSKQFGSSGEDRGSTIAVDTSGNLYVSGYFMGTADFDSGPGTAILASEGHSDIFLFKLSSSGNLVWAKQFGGSNFDGGYAVAVDTSGNVYVSGYFMGTADFDPGPNAVYLASPGPNGYTDSFVVKLNSEGTFSWARQIGSSLDDEARSIAVDSTGNVYVVGHFKGTVDFDPGSGVANQTSFGDSDAFVVKWDSAGEYYWAKVMGGYSVDYGYSVAVDSSSNVYVVGMLARPNADVFVQKWSSSGDYVWARALGGSSPDYGRGVAVDSSGSVYVAGYFMGMADFDPGIGTANLTSAGLSDVFLVKLDDLGWSVATTTTPSTTPTTSMAPTTTPSAVSLGTTTSVGERVTTTTPGSLTQTTLLNSVITTTSSTPLPKPTNSLKPYSSVTSSAVLKLASVVVPKGGKVTVSARSSVCRFSSGRLFIFRTGRCVVTFTITDAKRKIIRRIVSLRADNS
jgi:Beta-propeller repeat